MSGVLHGIVAALKTAAAATDSFFKYVTLLLHGDGTNGAQNNTFLDGSTNNFSITRNGNTTQGSFSPFSQTGWSNYFDGTGDNLSAASNAAFDILSGGDFTVECWFYANSLPSNSGFGAALISRDNTGATAGFIFRVLPTALEWVYPGLAANSQSFTFVTNTWYHVAAVRSSGAFRLYINGTQYSPTYSDRTADSATAVLLGASTYTLNTAPFTGYISNARIVKGTAVYTAAFTPPTSPLTAITNTSLLTCQSNRFIDNSSNAFAITRNGDVRVEAFSPFNPSTTYSTANVGGSGYFDGAGDTLVTPSITIGTNAFCFECWFYPTVTQGAIAGIFVAVTNNGLQCSYYSTTGLGIAQKGIAWQIFGGSLPTVGQWNHIAFVRSGTGTNQTSIFLNGTRTVNGTVSYSYAASTYELSTTMAAGTVLQGYMGSARLTVGSSPYDATQTTLTIPTSPLTAITDTQLLLNFTNGGVFDNASQTVLETVGNAQVSTTQKKFGTGSMYFDGTGDWLTAIDRPPLRFGTGPFTIECWLYLGATGAARGIIAKGTSTTGWLLSTDASNKVVFTYGTSTITSTAALSGSTWYFLTVVREGTGTNQTKIYIDGTNDGTGTVSTDFNQTSVMYIGANRTGGDALNGYIDDLRITNGYARYTANFTAPTAAFPDN